MHLVTSSQMRSIEERAINELGIPSLLLMENAALQVVKHIKGSKALVICGFGNNGGDGFAIARLLKTKGMDVNIHFIGKTSKMAGSALTNRLIAEKMGLISEQPLPELLHSSDVIIDAIFGTGLRGKPPEEVIQVISAINSYAAKKLSQSRLAQTPLVISVDIPSGVEADTGKVAETAVRAHTTIAFGAAKIGHMLYPGTEYAGKVIIENISIPKEMLIPSGFTLEILDDLSKLPQRPARSNKGTFGRVCVLAGCSDMPGAAALCCKAAYKAGAGLVHACVEKEVAQIIQSSAHEVITSDIGKIKEAIKTADVIALGPGIGRGNDKKIFVHEVLEYCSAYKKPMVIDADGLIAVADNKTVLQKPPACVITPHPGEMAVLTGKTIAEVLEDIVASARNFAQEFQVVTLLKDARTIIAAPDGRCFVNPTGTPALAKAGSGDVLTGVIAAFMAQNCDALMAAVLGAYIHGKAGQMAAAELSVYGVCASEVASYVGKALYSTDAKPAFPLPDTQSSKHHVL